MDSNVLRHCNLGEFILVVWSDGIGHDLCLGESDGEQSYVLGEPEGE